MDLKIKRGLDIPIAGKPTGIPQELPKPKQISLNLTPFEEIRFRLLKRVGEYVKIGEPLVENKAIPEQFFVSPACGLISEIRRGEKRQLHDIVIEVAETEEYAKCPGVALSSISKEELVAFLLKTGVFPHIRMRPFDLVADPKHLPRDIFISALESLPFVPPSELQVAQQETSFHIGISTLKKLTQGTVHLVYRKGTECKAFTEAQDVERHTVSGPHPAANSSVHIHFIAPIKSAHDHVWTLSVLDVITIGKMVQEGKYLIQRILSVSGNGVAKEKRGYFRGRAGYPVSSLCAESQSVCLISGDPLTGTKVEPQDFINFNHSTLSVIPQNTKREPLHFLRFGTKKFSATKTYLPGFRRATQDGYHFTTNQNGEIRPFVDGETYDKVMPMRIPTIHLIKSLIAEDFETAELFGLFEVCAADFALPTFICPSKIGMMSIVKKGLHRHSKEMGYEIH